MNGFEKHGITYTSPTSINMYVEAPCAWAAKYLFGAKFKFGVAAKIGLLVEDVVAEVLLGRSFDESLSDAEQQYRKYTALNTSEKDIKRIQDIKPMSELALNILKPYGEPEFAPGLGKRKQQKIEIKCQGGEWELPIIGYLDFVFPKHGLIIDLKTTLRCPTTMTDAHQRQASIYSAAKGNMDCKMLYVTPKKTNLLGVDDKNRVLTGIKNVLRRQESFLRFNDKDQIRSCVPLNEQSFYWNGNESLREELYG